MIGSTDELVAAQRPHLSELGNPGEHSEDITGKGGAKILNPVHPGHPRRAKGLSHLRATRRGGVLEGGLLHPLHISDIVYVPVSIHHLGGHDDLKAINRFHATSRRLRLLFSQVSHPRTRL